MVPARCELPGHFGDDPIATAPLSGLFGVLSAADISAGVFIPSRGGTDRSGAAKFLLDLLGPPDGEVAAGRRCRFLFSDFGCGSDRVGWGDGAGAARATGSVWRRPDRDSTAVGGLFGVLSLRHFGSSFYPLARGYRRIRRGEAIKGNKAIARQSPLPDLSVRRAFSKERLRVSNWII